MLATTPKEIDTIVAEFVAGLGTGTDAVSVPVRPESYARHGQCVYNVQKKVQLSGGKPLNGWVIWYAPGDLIEAEYHTVWQSATGELADITLKADGERTVLFVPDPTSTWAGERRIDNVRRALSVRAKMMVKMAAMFMPDWDRSAPLRDATREEIMSGVPQSDRVVQIGPFTVTLPKSPREKAEERRRKAKSLKKAKR